MGAGTYTLPWTYAVAGGTYTTAGWSRDFIFRQGVCANYDFGPIPVDPTVLGPALDYLSDSTAGQAIGRVRIGRIGIGNTVQRTMAKLCADRGIAVSGGCSDFGSPTPKTRAMEMLTAYKATDGSPAPIDMLEMQNEPNYQPGGTAYTIAQYAADTSPPFTDRSSTVQKLPPLELRYQAAQLCALRNDPDVLAALAGRAMPDIASPQYAGMGGRTWNSTWKGVVEAHWNTSQDVTLGNAHPLNLATMFDRIGVHQYPSGGVPTQFGYAAEQLTDARTVYGTVIPSHLVETGYYWVTPLSGNAVSEADQAKYVPRVFLDNFASGYTYVSLFQLFDTEDRTQADEKFRGVFRTNGDAKPAATAWRNMNRLFKDTATAYVPQPLPGSISAPAGVAWSLWQRSDRVWVLALTQPAKVAGASGTLTVTASLDRARTVTVYKPSTSASAQSSSSTASPSIAVGDEAVIVTIA